VYGAPKRAIGGFTGSDHIQAIQVRRPRSADQDDARDRKLGAQVVDLIRHGCRFAGVPGIAFPDFFQH
jgi:hypothetical protein